MKKKILYVHNANFSSFGANKIQVVSMCEAFDKINVDTTLLGFGESSQKVRKTHDLNKNIKLKILHKQSIKLIANPNHLATATFCKYNPTTFSHQFSVI